MENSCGSWRVVSVAPVRIPPATFAVHIPPAVSVPHDIAVLSKIPRKDCAKLFQMQLLQRHNYLPWPLIAQHILHLLGMLFEMNL